MKLVSPINIYFLFLFLFVNLNSGSGGIINILLLLFWFYSLVPLSCFDLSYGFHVSRNEGSGEAIVKL
jgi:hypothetical protein